MPISPVRSAPLSDPVAATAETRRARRGFSLIELMVVLAVIALIVSLVIPQMSYVAGVEMKSAARNLVGAIRVTYAAAATRRNYFRMVFDLENQRYWVEERSGTEYVASTEPLLQPRTLSESIYLKRVEVGSEVCASACTVAIYFTPGGYMEEASIYLATADDARTVSVFTRPMTGRSQIVMGEVARKDWDESEEKY